MSGVEDMMRKRQQNQRGSARKPPPRHPRNERADEAKTLPDVAADTKTGGVADQGVQNGPVPAAESTGPHDGGNQTEQQVDVAQKDAQAPKPEQKPKPSKPAAKKPPASTAKRADQDGHHQGPELGGAVVALRGEAERKQVEVAALEWAAAARKLGEKAAKLKTAVDAATKAETPPELLVAALVQAEGRSGYKVPDQVRSLAEGEQKAR